LKRVFERVARYLDERLGLPTAWRRFTDRNLPGGIGWIHTLGSATLFLLLVQVVTGIFLAFYYVPSPEHAYQSVRQITDDLTFGWLVRGIHKWAAQFVVVFVVLHLLRVLFMGAYKYPRELTWVVGVFLLLVIFAFGFTGYLLPWDQRAYWATVVGTDIASYAPLIGDFVMKMLRGGQEVGVRTLGRFYAFHTLFLPAALVALTGIHLTMVIKQGIAPPPVGDFASVARSEYAIVYERLKRVGHPFFRSMFKDSVVALALTTILIVLAWQKGAPLEEPADPTSPTYVPRPEWYFYFLFELLWWFPGRWIPVATFWIPVTVVLALLFLPCLDRSPHRAPLRRPVTTTVTLLALLMVGFLTYKGATAPLPSTMSASERLTPGAAENLSPLLRRGLVVYDEQGCSACHRIRGVGSAAAPDLSEIASKRDAASLRRVITAPAQEYPGTKMPPYADLSTEDMAALLAYLGTLK